MKKTLNSIEFFTGNLVKILGVYSGGRSGLLVWACYSLCLVFGHQPALSSFENMPAENSRRDLIKRVQKTAIKFDNDLLFS